MQTKIQKWGNSQAIRLPKTILELAQITENEHVDIFVEKDKIIIKKSDKIRHKTLKERLNGFEDKYEFEEWNTGEPVGKEVL